MLRVPGFVRDRRLDRNGILVLVAVLGFVVPSLADLCSRSWKRWVFGWVAADTFYYLTVARNVARHGHWAYDQEHPSNGFHPLWQVVCAGVAVVLRALQSEEGLLLTVLLIGLALTAASIPLAGRFLTASGPRLSSLFPLLPIGFYAFLILPIWLHGLPSMAIQNPIEGPMPLYGTLWSDANGMESALVVYFFAYSALSFVRGDLRRSARDAGVLGLALAGVVLSRLDHALLVLPVLLGAAVWILTTSRRRGPVLALVGAFALPLVVYMANNFHYYGTLAPVSGALKSSFPHVANDNFDEMVAFWTRPWSGSFLPTAYRHLPAEIPAIVALIYLLATLEFQPLSGAVLVRMRTWTGPQDGFLALASIGVLLLAGYDILFVRWYHQGHWYFPASTLYVSLVVLSSRDLSRRTVVAGTATEPLSGSPRAPSSSTQVDRIGFAGASHGPRGLRFAWPG